MIRSTFNRQLEDGAQVLNEDLGLSDKAEKTSSRSLQFRYFGSTYCERHSNRRLINLPSLLPIYQYSFGSS